MSEQIRRWGAYDVMDPVDLVELIIAWEERVQAQNFKEDTSDSPNVHLDNKL